MPMGAQAMGFLLPPALLVLLVPRRWLGRAMLFWLVMPVLGYAVVAIGEAARQPPGEHTLYNAFYGFMLISPILAPLWLAGSGIGFGAGLLLRRLRREPPLAQARAQRHTGNPAATAPLPMPRPAPPDVRRPLLAGGWRHVHIGFSGDELEINGEKVWRQPWREVPLPSVLLPHPAHPAQMHRHEIHEIGDPAAPVRFAAGELSNSVWGFWVRQPQAGGPGLRSLVSPDARLHVALEPLEFGNGHWRSAPQVTDIDSGRVLLDLLGTDWDAGVNFPAPHQVRLDLSSIRGGRLALLIDAARDCCRVIEDASGGDSRPEAPLSQIPALLAEAEARAAMAKGSATRPPQRFAAWRSALLIFVGALLAILAATLFLEPPQRGSLTPTLRGSGLLPLRGQGLLPLRGHEAPPLAKVPTLVLPPERR